MSSLGPRFLRRLYRRIVRDRGSFVLVAAERGPRGRLRGRVDRRGRALPELRLARRRRRRGERRRAAAPLEAASVRDPAPRFGLGARAGAGPRAAGHRRRRRPPGVAVSGGQLVAAFLREVARRGAERRLRRGGRRQRACRRPLPRQPASSTASSSSSTPVPSRSSCSGTPPGARTLSGRRDRPELAGVAFGVTVVVDAPRPSSSPAGPGIVDRPGALKPQSRAVPYLGGVAVLAGLAAGGRASAGPWCSSRSSGPRARRGRRPLRPATGRPARRSGRRGRWWWRPWCRPPARARRWGRADRGR